MSELLEQKTKKQCTVAFILAFLLLVVVVILMFVNRTMQAGAAVLQKNLAMAEGQDVTALKRAVREYEEHATLLDDALIPQDATIPFLEDLQRLADRAGVASEITSIELFDITETNERIRTSPGIITAERAHGELYLVMTTQGAWSDTMNFLASLEALPHQLTIQNMRLSFGKATSDAPPMWSAGFSIQVTTQ